MVLFVPKNYFYIFFTFLTQKYTKKYTFFILLVYFYTFFLEKYTKSIFYIFISLIVIKKIYFFLVINTINILLYFFLGSKKVYFRGGGTTLSKVSEKFLKFFGNFFYDFFHFLAIFANFFCHFSPFLAFFSTLKEGFFGIFNDFCQFLNICFFTF